MSFVNVTVAPLCPAMAAGEAAMKPPITPADTPSHCRRFAVLATQHPPLDQANNIIITSDRLLDIDPYNS